ncbi:MAG TPA: MBL fold metallo-hydrolase [Solirubrobacteraceae bacterium]|nr:MBL fold metallo-hydrolase [Solirubrobacteraceae bacterium]
MRVHLCGVRGSTPAPGADFLRYGGHTSCVAIAHEQESSPTLILDAGTGIRSVTGLLDEQAFSGTILLTHLHWDHVQGLPFFHAGDHPDARVQLLLPAQEDGADASAVLARSMSPPHFPMEPDQLRGTWSFATLTPDEQEFDGFTVLAREIPHKGGRTYGYRVSDGHSTFTYMPDHCPTTLGAGPDGCGEYHPAALELAAETDVLLHDSQLLTCAELAAEGRFGHAIADYAVELGRHAGARRVLLAHHRPDRGDDALDQLKERFAGSSGVEVIVAAQDSVLQL